MKVLILSPSLSSRGGIQRYTATLQRALEDEFGKAAVACIFLPGPNGAEHASRLTTRSKFGFGCHAITQTARWRPDLIICTHLALGPIGWLSATYGRCPYWVVVHGIEAWATLSHHKLIALRHADRVLATSVFNQQQVTERQRIDAQKMARLPCTLDDTLLAMQPSSDGLFGRSSSRTRVILTVARMSASERYKGHDIVLRALPAVLAKHPEVVYAVVGDGDDKRRLQALAANLGISQHVLFTGQATDSELATLYNGSEVFVLPARTVLDPHVPKGEGFGIVFLEAMAFGKPVIAPDYGAPAELIQHGTHGILVNPENPAAVADAILTLLNNPEMAQRMGQAGKQWVSQNYSYTRFRERLREILASSFPSQIAPGAVVTHAHS